MPARATMVAAVVLAGSIAGPARGGAGNPSPGAPARRRPTPTEPGIAPAAAPAALAAAGKAHLDRGELAQAIELLSESVARDADDERPAAWLVLAYARRGDFAFGSSYLERIAERPPSGPVDPAVYREIGDRFAAANDLDSAVLAWQLYRRSGGTDPVVVSRLDRARRERSASPGQRSIANDTFTIFADESIPAGDLQRVEKTLAREYERESSLFGIPLAGPQVVILYGGRRYFSLVSIPNWVSGVFDGKIRISVDVSRPLGPEIDAVLSHELAHAFIRERSHGRAPVWLHEGLAQWCSGRRIPAGEFRAELGARHPLGLAEMEAAPSGPVDPAKARASYAEALGLIEYLVAARGEGSVFCLVRDLGEGIRVTDALRRETSLSPEELLAAWKVWAGL